MIAFHSLDKLIENSSYLLNSIKENYQKYANINCQFFTEIVTNKSLLHINNKYRLIESEVKLSCC